MTMTLNTPPQVEEANAILLRLEALKIRESLSFDPPIPSLVVHVLYLLLQSVDKGWRISAPPCSGGFWSRLKAGLNQPVDLGGNPIAQTISEIQRTR